MLIRWVAGDAGDAWVCSGFAVGGRMVFHFISCQLVFHDSTARCPAGVLLELRDSVKHQKRPADNRKPNQITHTILWIWGQGQGYGYGHGHGCKQLCDLICNFSQPVSNLQTVNLYLFLFFVFIYVRFCLLLLLHPVLRVPRKGWPSRQCCHRCRRRPGEAGRDFLKFCQHHQEILLLRRLISYQH
jgi:hypothetical protein